MIALMGVAAAGVAVGIVVGFVIGLTLGGLPARVADRVHGEAAAAVVVAWADRCAVAELVGDPRIEIEADEVRTLYAAIERLL